MLGLPAQARDNLKLVFSIGVMYQVNNLAKKQIREPLWIELRTLFELIEP